MYLFNLLLSFDMEIAFNLKDNLRQNFIRKFKHAKTWP